MRVTVKLFGNEAKLAGCREVAVDLSGDPPTAADVRTALAQSVPALAAGATRARIAVNHEFADETTPIGENDEIALIGQVSGG